MSVVSRRSSDDTGATANPRAGTATSNRSAVSRFMASRSGEKLNP